jgi:hypothetical protein
MLHLPCSLSVCVICSSIDCFPASRRGVGANMAGELVAALKSLCGDPDFLAAAVANHMLVKVQCALQLTEAAKLGCVCLGVCWMALPIVKGWCDGQSQAPHVSVSCRT